MMFLELYKPERKTSSYIKGYNYVFNKSNGLF